MALTFTWRAVFAAILCLAITLPTNAQTSASTAPTTPPPTSSPLTNSSSTSATSTSRSSAATKGAAPDVYLNVPELSVGRIELDVDNLQADINLNAKVASLVTLNAGVQVSIERVNITIADVEAELELVVRLGHLVDIVNRVFESLDLNPLLLNTINGVTDLLDTVVGEVDGLLGSITQGGRTLRFVVDNLGNVVQSVDGGVGSIVGDYKRNMTETGSVKELGQGLVQRTFSYEPLSALVDIVFNKAGQVVQATVEKGGSGSGSSSSSSAVPTATGIAS